MTSHQRAPRVAPFQSRYIFRTRHGGWGRGRILRSDLANHRILSSSTKRQPSERSRCWVLDFLDESNKWHVYQHRPFLLVDFVRHEVVMVEQGGPMILPSGIGACCYFYIHRRVRKMDSQERRHEEHAVIEVNAENPSWFR